MFLASHAQVTSKRYVHFAPGRAQGTCATSTPWSGHCTRGAADSRNVRVVPVSTVRHRLVPTPASYPGHDRRHCAHLPPDRASGRTDTTRTSPSPSGSGCMVTSPTTMPWTPINCPNTLVLRMPCPSPSFRSISKTTTTAGRGMSPQSRWSGTHYNVTRAFKVTSDLLGLEGFGTVEAGLVNIAQKLARPKALRENGRMDDPANEAVADTFLDLAVYGCLVYAMQRQA